MNQIAVDGPAGAGKSTVSRLAAEKLGFMYVDTGAMYRTIALECAKKGVNTKNEEDVSALCGVSEIKISFKDGIQHMYIGSDDVSGQIRTGEIAMGASDVAKYASVRTKLVELQKKLGEEYDVIMDGRDIAECVLPGAQLKVFLTASPQARAMRRFNEYKAKGISCGIEEIIQDIEKRDYEDSHREISPLRQAKDALVLDTSDMSIDEAVDEIIRMWNSAGA